MARQVRVQRKTKPNPYRSRDCAIGPITTDGKFNQNLQAFGENITNLQGFFFAWVAATERLRWPTGKVLFLQTSLWKTAWETKTIMK